ncbi:hypothetical protein F502_14890 [Clostridium pasteurianum DSM 525 = ATCC 6013]|nr:hypothetical protein F502_14890 [Clostridium pasteurianum DSM 525 = ATCC 6013]
MCLSIGLQLYSINDKRAADFKSAIRKSAEIGYKNLKN